MTAYEFADGSGDTVSRIPASAAQHNIQQGSFNALSWTNDANAVIGGPVLRCSANNADSTVVIDAKNGLPPYTVECIFKPETGPANNCALISANDENAMVGLYIYGSNRRVVFYVSCFDDDHSAYHYAANMDTLPPGQWLHVIGRVNTNGSISVQGGVLFNAPSRSASGNLPANFTQRSASQLGYAFNDPLNAWSFPGLIAAIRHWPRYLSDSDISPLWTDPWAMYPGALPGHGPGSIFNTNYLLWS